MQLLQLKIACPKCGSEDITYSCEPDCCFNHVCGNCLNGFQLLTRDTGRRLPLPNIAAPDRDSCEPTTACARCNGLSVWMIAETDDEEPESVCLSCGSILSLYAE